MPQTSKRTLIGIIAGAAIAIGVAIAIMMYFATSSLSPTNNKQTNTVEAYSLDGMIHGKTYDEWTQEWWKIFMATPAAVNPANDDRGKFCGTGDAGPVHMLYGTTGGQADRSCTIPFGKDILMTTITGDCTRLTDKLDNDKDLTACTENFVHPKWIKESYVEIDGVRVPDEQIVYFVSKPYDVENSENNVYDLPAGTDRVVSAGDWFFWKSPARGEYMVTQAGSIENNVDNYGWTTVVNWKLTIE